MMHRGRVQYKFANKYYCPSFVYLIFSSVIIFFVFIQAVKSKSGIGVALRNALWHAGDTKDQV